MAPPTSTAKQSPVNMLNKKVMRLAVGAEFAEKLAEDALQLGSETKLRGTEVTTLLQQAGYTFSKETPNPKKLRPIEKSGAAESLYDLSKDVEEIDSFVSHSWADGRATKFVSLAIHFRAWNAMLWALVPTVPAFFLQSYYAANGSIDGLLNDADHGVKMGGGCHVVWGLSFLTMLFVGAPTPFQKVYCFLDRLCIHQTDSQLKRRGIDSLGGFLAHSKRMVVIYSSSYITRLWCIFELAAKVRTHGASAIDIMPTAACTAIGTPCVMCMTCSFVLIVCGALGFHSMDEIMESPAAIPMLATVILNVAMPFRMAGSLQSALRKTEAELGSLSVKKLDCYMERDRTFVEGCILRWYGSIGAFEDTVQNELLTDLKKRGSLRKIPCFSYNQACIIFFHSIIMNLDTFAFTPTAVTIARLPVIVANTFAVQPLGLAFYTLIAEACYQLHLYATRKVHAKFPKGPIWFLGFFVCFIQAQIQNMALNAPNGWSLSFNISWTIPVFYLCLKVYAVQLPQQVEQALKAASVIAISYLTYACINAEVPPPPECHFSFPRGCMPSNAVTASCTFKSFKCEGVGF